LIILLFKKKIVILGSIFTILINIVYMAKETPNISGTTYNALTNGSKIAGNIIADKDFRIDGEVQGDIQCRGKVIIGQTGFLKGTITCINAEIIGTVQGDVIVQESLTLRSTANLHGRVKTKVLVVEPNAVFNGTCSMKENTTEE